MLQYPGKDSVKTHRTYSMSSIDSNKCSKRFFRSSSHNDLTKYLDHGERFAELNRWCFETAWEVANKVGGIYTVIRSKTGVSVGELGDQYILVGPYKKNQARQEIEEEELPPNHPLGQAVASQRSRGYNIICGRWLVEGNPKVILFDIGSAAGHMNSFKQELYEKAGIGIAHVDMECNDVVIFGFMVAQFLADFSVKSRNYSDCPPRIVAHFHEWMSGVALILLRLWKVDLATIFTTHATLLGRHLCASETDFYNRLSHFNLDIEAGKRGFYHRYCLERAAAHLAHVFTTVSQITGLEAECLLKRKPCLITPNGLSVTRDLHEFQNRHNSSKEKIHDFVRGHFYGHLDFDLNKTLYLFTAGRYEYMNKGADVFIEALARLNYYLKSSNTEVTIVAFLIFPTRSNSFNVESLRGNAITKATKATILEMQKTVGKRLYDTCLRGNIPIPADLLLKEDSIKLKRCMLAGRSPNLPPITTHNIVDCDKDPVMNAIRRCQLLNNKKDRVKVIFHPEFLSSTNPLFGLDYNEFARGCHMGVFPSYYEPWGYTPAECTVMGIPIITTNLSGFGSFMEEKVTDPQSYGIYIVDRRHIALEESVQQLAGFMFDFTKLNQRQRIIQRSRTERLSDLLDWKSLGIYYRIARMKALAAVFPDVDEEEEVEVLSGAQFHRPLSEPSSTPRGSVVDSEEELSHDSEEELEALEITNA